MISILTPSLNHSRYIDFFISSLLEQSLSDFELIIVDDGSSDDTVARARSYKDARIKVIEHDFNRGINSALATAFGASSGDILVHLDSDDAAATPHALDIINETFRKNPQILALYSPLVPIDADNSVIERELFGYINQQPKSRAELLAHLFTTWNCCNFPGLSIRREAFAQLTLPASLLNFHDYRLHVGLLAQGEVAVLAERLFSYRMPMANSSHASAPNAANGVRQQLETFALMDAFLEVRDIALLEAAFSEQIAALGVRPEPETLQFFYGLLALQSRHYMRKIWGYQQIMQAFQSDAGLLHARYGFTFASLRALTSAFGA